MATSTWLVDEAPDVRSLLGVSDAEALETTSLVGDSETDVSETGLLTGVDTGFVGETTEALPIIVALLSIVLLDKRIFPLPLSPQAG